MKTKDCFLTFLAIQQVHLLCAHKRIFALRKIEALRRLEHLFELIVDRLQTQNLFVCDSNRFPPAYIHRLGHAVDLVKSNMRNYTYIALVVYFALAYSCNAAGRQISRRVIK